MSSIHGIATRFNTHSSTFIIFYSICVQTTFCQTTAKGLGWWHDKFGTGGSKETSLEERNLLLGNIRGVGLQARTQTFELTEHNCGESGL